MKSWIAPTQMPSQRASRTSNIAASQMIELRSLRDLAADLYSFNTMTIEAQEVQSKMAALRRQHEELTPSGESMQAQESPAASSSAAGGPVLAEQAQEGHSLVAAFTGKQLFDSGNRQQPEEGRSAQQEEEASPQSAPAESLASSSADVEAEVDSEVAQSRAEEPDEAEDEVARMANAMWEGTEDDSKADTQMDAEPPRELSGSLEKEQEAHEQLSSDPSSDLDGLQRLEEGPELSVTSASAAQPGSGVAGNGSSAQYAERDDGQEGLQMPLRGDEKQELRQLQQELPLELHSGGHPC